MKKSRLIIASIFIIIMIFVFLLVTQKDRRINFGVNETNETTTTEEASESEVKEEENQQIEKPSLVSALGWILALIAAGYILVSFQKNKDGQDFDYSEFAKKMRKIYGDPTCSVYQPLKTVVGCDLGYVKGKFQHQRVAITFTDRMLERNNFEGSPPAFMLHNFLVDPRNMRVHVYRKNLTHDDFLKFNRNVEFRSTGYPQAPTETSDPVQEAIKEHLSKKAGAEQALEVFDEL